MALVAMESVRAAEIKAQQEIDNALSRSESMVSKAKSDADAIISDAENYAALSLEKSCDKAYAEAEEIVVTAKNSALLEADKLKLNCESRQQEVNDLILNLLV